MSTDTVYVLLQEGGSSTEVYLHAHTTMEEAEEDRLSCLEASYRTSPIIEVPRALGDSEGFYDFAEQIARLVFEFDYPKERTRQ